LFGVEKDLFPRQKSVVDLQGPRSDIDDAANFQRRDSYVDEAKRMVEPLNVGVPRAYREAERPRAARARDHLDCGHQFMSDALSPKGRTNFDVLQLRRVRAREIRMGH